MKKMEMLEMERRGKQNKRERGSHHFSVGRFHFSAVTRGRRQKAREIDYAYGKLIPRTIYRY